MSQIDCQVLIRPFLLNFKQVLSMLKHLIDEQVFVFDWRCTLREVFDVVASCI